jgi:hypothetical protein
VESLMGRARANLKKELAAVYKKDN